MRTALSIALLLLIGPVLRAGEPGEQREARSALERDPAGWLDLLADGLKSWKRVPIPPGGKLAKKNAWSIVQNGKQKTLVCDGVGVYEMLLFDREFTDGIFHVEWRFKKVDGKKAYASGVYVRNFADGSIWHQAQIASKNVGHVFGATMIDGKKGNIPANKLKGPQRGKEEGEWNTFEITCKGKNITLWVNGFVTAEWPTCEVPRGFLGFEAEGFWIEFKNIRFKELK